MNVDDITNDSKFMEMLSAKIVKRLEEINRLEVKLKSLRKMLEKAELDRKKLERIRLMVESNKSN